MRRHPADPVALEQHFAGAGDQKAGNRLERGALAGAVRADQGDDLALLDLELDPLERVDVPVVGVDVLQFEHFGFAHWPLGRVSGGASMDSPLSASAQVANRRVPARSRLRHPGSVELPRQVGGALAEVRLDHLRIALNLGAGVPSAILSPWSSTATRSEMPITTFMSCSISRIVRSSPGASGR